MKTRLFTKIYLDEDMPPILAKFLKTKGFDVVSAHDINALGLNDGEQLRIAVNNKRTLISNDKQNFLINSKANSMEHFGIILITASVKLFPKFIN